MRDLAHRKRRSLARWHDLVAATASDIDQLARQFVTEVRAIPSYQSSVIPDDEMKEWATTSMSLILSASATRSAALGSVPIELGRRRARQGIAGEDLVAAVQLDFKLLWSTLRSKAEESDAMVLMMNVEDLWAVVDEYAREVQRSFLEERALMAAAARDEQQTYLADLFVDGLVPRKVELIARALGVRPDATFRVVACDAKYVAFVREVATSLAAGGDLLFAINQPGRLVVFWPAPSSATAPEPQIRLLRSISGGWVQHVEGLADVRAAADTAYEVLRTMRPAEKGLVELDETWPRIARQHLDGHRGFMTALLADLEALPDEEQEILVETVRSYLATGSIARCAERLYCHRNTVLNRLTRFKNLTGLDVTIPQQAALACVALA